MNEWISVRDRMPEDDTYVLVYSGGRYQVAAHTSDNGNCWYQNGRYFMVATHWMPLPEPPNTESKYCP